MSNVKFMFSVLLGLLVLPGMVSAACSIGANPLHLSASGVPGEIVVVTWNLYNIHGDRITHVVVSGAEGNPGWDYYFDPQVHSATYNVTGSLEEIDENIGLAPTDTFDEIPDPRAEGYEYVYNSKLDAYIPVRPIDIIVEIPEDAELFEDYVFEFPAVGNCFMNEGTVIPGISTSLELTIRTISGEDFFEAPVDTPTPTLINEPEVVPIDAGNNDILTDDQPSSITNEVDTNSDVESNIDTGEGITGFIIGNAPWVGIVAILIIIILVIGFRGKSSGGYDAKRYSWTPPS